MPSEVGTLDLSIVFTCNLDSVLAKKLLVSSKTSSILLSSLSLLLDDLNGGICICLDGLVSSFDEGYVLIELLELGISYSCYYRP